MNDQMIIGTLVLVLLVFFHVQSANQRISHLKRVLAVLRAKLLMSEEDVRRLKSQNDWLRSHHGSEHPGQKKRDPAEEDSKQKDWQLAWAREVLEFYELRIKEDDLNRIRKAALKKTHPDAGGSSERFGAVEDAVRIFRQKILDT